MAFLQATGTMGQTLQFTSAGQYALSFQVAQRVNYQHGGEDFQVLIDGNVIGTFFPTSTNYALYSTNTFTETTGDHVLTFQGLDSRGNDNSVLIDTVTIALV